MAGAGGARAADFDRGQNQSVLDRASAAYQPDGIPISTFRFYPKLEVDETYDDNIYATPSHTTADAITVLAPQFKLTSGWSQNQLNLYGSAAISRYASKSTENSDAGILGATGRLDVYHDLEIDARVEHQHQVEPRYDPSSASLEAAGPTVYELQIESLQVAKTINRVRLTTLIENDRYDYGDVPLQSGAFLTGPVTLITQGSGSILVQGPGNLLLLGPGNVLDERYRSHNSSILQQTVEYALSPATAFYASAVYNTQGYDRTAVAIPYGLNQNSDGYQVTFGANFDITHLMRGQVGGGYITQNAHDPRLADYSGPSVQANVDYFITPIVTLHLLANRSVNASGIVGAPAYFSTNVQFGVDYEFRRNFVLSASAAGGWDDYGRIGRNDTRQSYNLNGKYYLNRNVGLSLQYERLSLSSHGRSAGLGYDIDQVTFAITLAR
jgi:hypothetical protein